MQVKKFLDRIHPFYHTEYGSYTYVGPDYYTKDYSFRINLEDQWPAICYAHGIYDVPEIDHIQRQIEFLTDHKTYSPRSAVEIGGGLGQISCALAYMGVKVQSIDVNPAADHYHALTYQHWFDRTNVPNLVMLLGDLDTTIQDLNLSDVDTVILVSSIEHIFSNEWQRFFHRALPIFKNNHTVLTITNRKNYWPLGTFEDNLKDPGHVHLIDDVFYDQLESFSQEILYRNQSHISVRF